VILEFDVASYRTEDAKKRKPTDEESTARPKKKTANSE
jgi:hypothetical protein